MNSLLKISWRNLFRNRRRTLFNILTITLGATSLLTYQGFNTGILSEYREKTIHGYYGHGQVFQSGYYSHVHEKPWKMWHEKPAEVEQKLKNIPGVLDVFPRISLFALLVNKGVNLGGKGEGIVAERENKFFNKMNFIEGHDIQSDDSIILGKGLAESLGVHAGDYVTVLNQTVDGQVNGADLVVAGIFHIGKKSIDDTFFRISLKMAQQLLNTDRVEMFSLGLEETAEWSTVANDIQKQDGKLDPISFEVLDKVYYQNSVDFLSSQFNFIRIIILLVVGLGIFNSISMSMLERAGEVGALRANGESRKRLLSILLVENFFLGIIGGTLGILLAILLNKTVFANGIVLPSAPGMTRPVLVYLSILPLHYLGALILPTLTSVVAGLWPTQKLLRRSIPDLLRST
ncbi:ABC transporter permease [Bdellovibrio sp. HCB337]|uniref:ABC transporter permease n=1 Tax=Bdellovibrio sp. HCB337 TaxID=3394358 RepID=UPI0039A5886B